MHRYSRLSLLLLLLLLIIIINSNTSAAQSPPTKANTTSSNDPSIPKANISQSASIMIIILISAFIFLVFFSVFFRQYAATSPASSSTEAPTLARSVKRHGLDPEILSTFPTLVYSEVKEHKLSKSALECAVCLNEFDDDETLRLLPNCSHAFHTECIDAWLAAHTTCPVCRCNLNEPVKNKDTVEDHVVVEVEDDEERKREMYELEEFVNMKRARYFRSYTTGHARFTVQPEENLERYTLRLPENVRNVIMLKRTSSCVVFSHEESEKKGFRATEKLGSFLKRTMTMKNGKFFRWDSSKSEAAARPKSSSFRHVISTFDCCPGGTSSVDYNKLNKDENSSLTDS